MKSHLCLVLLCGLVWLAPRARADKADFLVNDDFDHAEQNHPRIAVAGDGSFVIIWVDRRAGAADIFLQRFTSAGTPLGSNQLINDDGGLYTYQSEPAIAVDLSGLYSVVWKDYRNGTYPFDPDIYFQRFDTSLSAIDENRSITIEQPDSLKETPDIALSPWGGGVVVWADYRNRNWDIYGQLISSSGIPVGANFQVNDDTVSAQQHMPRVAVSPEGWFAVAWYDNRLGDDDIFVQRFDSLAAPQGSNHRVNSDSTDSRQAFPSIATDGAGHFTVVWVDWRNGVYPSNPDIYARKFDTTMDAITDDELVNLDGTSRAQREPTISADRRGNVAIIWSDSTGTTQLYDIRGQMIDVEGVIREVNFQANSDADSAQLHPDVALDGRYRYITWADKRNGNYDIYASITKYNEPTLVPSPPALQFRMLVGTSAPASQTLTIDHYGYNPLHFQALVSHDWFSVTPASGTTAADVTVSITTDTLPFGTYLGALTLFDVDNNDSTVQVSVRLDVTAPILDVATDTLQYLVFAGVPDSTRSPLAILNVGAGNLNWSVNESFDWLSVQPSSGPNSDTVEVWVSGATLAPGSSLDFFEVVAPEAIGAPDTVWVSVEAVNDQPYILLSRDSIKIITEAPADVSAFVIVSNPGTGSLNWTASVNDSWLQLDRISGTDNDTILFTIDILGLPPGLHTTWVDIADDAAFHSVERLMFVLDYLIPSADTVLVGSVETAPHEVDSFRVDINLIDSAVGLTLPLAYDTGLVTVDSVRYSASLPEPLTLQSFITHARGIVTLTLAAADPGGALAPGFHELAWVHFTAGPEYGLFETGEPSDPDQAAVLATPAGNRLHPVTLPGEIRIDLATVVEAGNSPSIPTAFTLAQNYPNPFNPSTTIELSLSRRSKVSLEVFNILGQRVTTLIDRTLSAGSHEIMWDGLFNTGRSAPSGIYFYRLRSANVSLVRKMVLIK